VVSGLVAASLWSRVAATKDGTVRSWNSPPGCLMPLYAVDLNSLHLPELTSPRCERCGDFCNRGDEPDVIKAQHESTLECSDAQKGEASGDSASAVPDSFRQSTVAQRHQAEASSSSGPSPTHYTRTAAGPYRVSWRSTMSEKIKPHHLERKAPTVPCEDRISALP
jgi:hypothetical protein